MSLDQSQTDVAAQLARARDQVRDLQAELAVYRFEVGTLQLQLDVMSTLDPITGLPNLHGMVELIDAAVHRRRRKSEPFAVMTVRIPRIIEIRENQGADAYHGALRHAGALITAGLRQMDRVGRLDEATFLAVLPDTAAAGVGVITERLERMLLAVPIDFGSRTVRLLPEISIVLCREDGSVESPELLDLLYEARDQSAFGKPLVAVATGSGGLEITIP